jgi:hypothetical protein
MNTSHPDIVITDPDGNPVASVEVKNRQNLSADTATILRRNLIVHGFTLPTQYYFLLSQDNGYLWKDVRLDEAYIPPTYQLPMGNVITRYLHSEPARRLSGPELELVILNWLTELTLEQPRTDEEPEHTLQVAGFIDAIQGGKVVAEAVV